MNVAIILFPEVELLDMAGPYEVFSTLVLPEFECGMTVTTYARIPGDIVTANGLTVKADQPFEELKHTDILVVPGGNGTRKLAKDSEFITQLAGWCSTAGKVLSICTGARLLAHAGLLDGLEVTTHQSAIDELRELLPESIVVENKRFTDNGKIITAAGVSSGIDASLYLIRLMYGEITARKIAKYIEWQGTEYL